MNPLRGYFVSYLSPLFSVYPFCQWIKNGRKRGGSFIFIKFAKLKILSLSVLRGTVEPRLTCGACTMEDESIFVERILEHKKNEEDGPHEDAPTVNLDISWKIKQ